MRHWTRGIRFIFLRLFIHWYVYAGSHRTCRNGNPRDIVCPHAHAVVKRCLSAAVAHRHDHDDREGVGAWRLLMAAAAHRIVCPRKPEKTYCLPSSGLSWGVLPRERKPPSFRHLFEGTMPRVMSSKIFAAPPVEQTLKYTHTNRASDWDACKRRGCIVLRFRNTKYLPAVIQNIACTAGRLRTSLVRPWFDRSRHFSCVINA